MEEVGKVGNERGRDMEKFRKDVKGVWKRYGRGLENA